MNLLTIPEVAERLKISLSGAYALTESGKLPSIPVGANGGNVRVDEADLDAFLEKRKRGQGAPSPKRLRPRLKHIKT